MADIFPPLENWTHRLHSVVNPVHGKQGWEGAWYASSSRFEGASPVYRLASLALRPSVVGTYQVHGMHEKTKLLIWIWVRWSWIIFLIIIFDNICRVVGVSQSVSCYVHTSLTLRQIIRTPMGKCLASLPPRRATANFGRAEIRSSGRELVCTLGIQSEIDAPPIVCPNHFAPPQLQGR